MSLKTRIEKLEQLTGEGTRYILIEENAESGEVRWYVDGQRLDCEPESRPGDMVIRFFSNVDLDAI